MEVASGVSGPSDLGVGISTNSPEFNEWVQAQRDYIMSLPLEVRGVMIEWRANSGPFMANPRGRSATLLNWAMENAPPLPIDILVFKGLRKIDFLPAKIEQAIGKIYPYASFYATTVRRAFAGKFIATQHSAEKRPHIMHIVVRRGTRCLFLQTYTGDMGEMLLPRDCHIHVLDCASYSGWRRCANM